MKTKSAIIFALILVVSVFFLPVTAFANAPSGAEQRESEQAETTASHSTESPDPNEPPRSPWADAPETGNPFTPDGSATVVDNATSDDGKEFFTFTTPEGNVFFLIIDRSRPNNNVYFLNAVTEADLMALAVGNPESSPIAPLPEPLPPPIQVPSDDEPEPPVFSAPEAPAGNNGTMIFIAIAALAFGGAAYYLKIVRPKQQGAAFDEGYDEYEDDEDFDNEGEYEDDEEEIYDVEDIIREFGSGEIVKSQPMLRQTAPIENTPKKARDMPSDRSETIADVGARRASPYEEIVKLE